MAGHRPGQDDAERTRRIRRVVEDCLRRRHEGEHVPDELLTRRHPDLMPELGEDLKLLQRFERIRLEVDALYPEYSATLTQHATAAVADDVQTDSSSSGSDSSHHGRFLPGTKFADRYRIVSLIGKGGMGEVYRADDLKLGQTVALKFLPKNLAEHPRRLEYFHSEVRLSRQITHPNVCRVYDIGEVDGDHFLSMEYVDGEDLKGLLRRIGRLPKDKGVEIAQQLCAGLAAAHERGVLHRDLKPANVMLDSRGQVRITDFGLARLAADGAEEVVGTPAYMAPEQLTRGETTIQSDLYSLGLILYEMFTGQRVHPVNSSQELLRIHQDFSPSPPPRPSTLVGDIDPGVERAILQCLEREPHERPQSVQAVAAALPGGDALGAMLATGQTPSPELVAHAASRRSLQPRQAILCLAAVIAMMILVAQINTRTKVYPEESPGWLSVQAAKLLEELGYDRLPRNSVAGFGANQALAEQGAAVSKSMLDESHWPPPYRYWRRWSFGALEPSTFHRPQGVRLDDPPQALPGSASVVLDSTGRLLELTVVPDPSEPPRPGAAVDWTALLRRAGIDALPRRQIQPVTLPPVYSDTVVAWRVSRPESGDFTVQAAAVGDRPVYFKLLGVSESLRAPREVGGAVVWALVWGTIFLAAIVLAWRNIRMGRADRKGAFRVAMFMLIGYLGVEALSIRLYEKPAVFHFSNILWDRAGGHIIGHAVHAWIMYLAIEPFVRRIWPRMLVGWVRLLSGRPRDPVVGREILLGTLIGVTLGMVGPLIDLVAPWFGMTSAAPVLPELPGVIGGVVDLSGPRSLMITSLINFTAALLWILVYVSILLVCRLVLEREWMSSVAAALLICFSSLASIGRFIELPNATPAAVSISVAFSVAVVFTMTRVGLLAAFFSLVMFKFAGYSAISTDFTAWYAAYSLFTFVVVFAIAGCGFFVSLAGQPILRDIFAAEQPARLEVK